MRADYNSGRIKCIKERPEEERKIWQEKKVPNQARKVEVEAKGRNSGRVRLLAQESTNASAVSPPGRSHWIPMTSVFLPAAGAVREQLQSTKG